MQFENLPDAGHPLVVLRPIVAADLPRWYGYLSKPEVCRHTSWNVTAPEQLAGYVWNPDAATPSSALRLAVALRSTDELVGTVGFHSVSPENRSVELAYDYAPEVWGQGLATHLAKRCVAWAHEEAGFLRVQATVLLSNAGSKAVLERCGFRHEGVMRSYRMVRGTPGDFHLYAHVVSPALPESLPATADAAETGVHVRLALPADRPALQRMLELYQHDLSDIWHQDLDAHGEYGYALERFGSTAGCHAFVATVDGRHAGFALVDRSSKVSPGARWMDQFFVLRKHRRTGLGRTLARQVLTSLPGDWEIGQMTANRAAQAFWRSVVADVASGRFEEHTISSGPWQGVVQCFRIEEGAAA